MLSRKKKRGPRYIALASGTAVFSGSKAKRMNTGAGFLNAFIVLALIAIAHTAIVTDGFFAPPPGPSGPPGLSGPSGSFGLSGHSGRVGRKRHPDYDWPPGPDQVPRVRFEPPPMRSSAKDDEERDALRRLVFSEPDQAETTRPGPKPVHRSRPALSAEGSTSTGLFLIRDDADARPDEVAGIEGWGAGFMTF